MVNNLEKLLCILPEFLVDESGHYHDLLGSPFVQYTPMELRIFHSIYTAPWHATFKHPLYTSICGSVSMSYLMPTELWFIHHYCVLCRVVTR